MSTHFHARGTGPGGRDRHLDVHLNYDDAATFRQMATGEVTLMVSRPSGEAVRVDVDKDTAIDLLEWLAEQTGYETVEADSWRSREYNLLLHYRGVTHNCAACPACNAGHHR